MLRKLENAAPVVAPGSSRSELAGVVVVIPARNEEAALPLVLRDLPATGGVIVVDNGSSDRTAEIASQHGANVVREPRIGYGSACLAGLAEIERQIASGAAAPQIVAFLDADYSDRSELLHQLVDPIASGEADLVLGSRLLGKRELKAMPLQSLLGNKLACLLMRLCWGVRYTDLGPFRAIRYRSLCSLRMDDRS